MIDLYADVISYQDHVIEAVGKVKVQDAAYCIETSCLLYKAPYLYAPFPSMLQDMKKNTLRSLAITLGNDHIYAKRIQLTLEDRSKFRGYRLCQKQKDHGHIRHGTYTACYLCPSNPTWKIKAQSIDYDENDVVYRHALLRIKGISVFYTPYFSHPHPKIKYRGGILVPVPGRSRDLGFSMHLPIYYPFSEKADITFTPIFSSKKLPILVVSNRHFHTKSCLELGGSYASLPEKRWHVNIFGDYRLNEETRLLIKVRRASDITYLLRYPIEKTTPAILPNQQKNLTSQFLLESCKKHHYTTISGYLFQTEKQSITPRILPYVQHDYHNYKGGFSYGSQSSFTFLERTESSYARRYQRVQGDLYLQHTKLYKGHVWENTVATKWDAYHVEPRDQTRFLISPQVQSTWSYPLVSHFGKTHAITEPLMQFMGQDTKQGFVDDISDHELDSVNLFRRYRLRSYNRLEKGGRMVAGIRQTFLEPNNKTTQFFFGKTSPLERGYKDFVSEVSTGTPFWGVRHRHALHRQGFRYSETGIRAGKKWEINLAHVFASHVGRPIHQGQWRVVAPLKKNWKMSLAHIHQLGPRQFPDEHRGLSQFLSFHYEDECLQAHIGFYRNEYRDRDIRPNGGFIFSLILRNLGPFELISGPKYPHSPLTR